jgi:hypothetical protein
MSDPVPSDHPAVDSHRVELDSVGSTNRSQIPLPAALSPDAGEFVRLVVGGTATHAEVGTTLRGDAAVRSAYHNRQRARTGDGVDLLSEWLDEHDHGPGSTLVLDVLTAGYAYGLREPGQRVVYDPVEQPRSSLQEIAENLDSR